MLVISRHRTEKVIISVNGIRIELMLVDIRGDKCRLGFEAPSEVIIHREEVQLAVDRANAAESKDGVQQPQLP